MTTSNENALLYVSDPMCSWCWGFAPVWKDICQTYGDRVGLHVLVGGLRPGNRERFDEHRRSPIVEEWHAVHLRTGQPFNFAFQMDEDFTYDTEPAARAVVTVRHIQPETRFMFFHAVQEAFYAENRDVSKEPVLSDIAVASSIDRERFQEAFRSPEMKKAVWDEFEACRQLGVTGFPTLLGKNGQAHTVLTHSYQAFDSLHPKIEAWLHTVGA